MKVFRSGNLFIATKLKGDRAISGQGFTYEDAVKDLEKRYSILDKEM